MGSLSGPPCGPWSGARAPLPCLTGSLGWGLWRCSALWPGRGPGGLRRNWPCAGWRGSPARQSARPETLATPRHRSQRQAPHRLLGCGSGPPMRSGAPGAAVGTTSAADPASPLCSHCARPAVRVRSTQCRRAELSGLLGRPLRWPGCSGRAVSPGGPGRGYRFCRVALGQSLGESGVAALCGLPSAQAGAFGLWSPRERACPTPRGFTPACAGLWVGFENKGCPVKNSKIVFSGRR